MRCLNFAVENPGKHCLNQEKTVKLTTVISHVESMSHNTNQYDVIRMEVRLCGHLPQNA